MIINEALGAWVSSPERQQATRRRMEDLAKEIGRLPAFAALEAQLPAAEAAGARWTGARRRRAGTGKPSAGR